MYLYPASPNSEGKLAANPVVIADIMATIEGSTAPKVLPSNVTKETRSVDSSATLVRKAYIFGDRAAVAFSGHIVPIRGVFEEIVHQMPIWLKSDRPMDPLTALVNEYPGIEIVGATLDPETWRANHIAPNESWVDIGALGTCAVVGSGRNELIGRAAAFERTIPAAARQDGTLARGFAAFIAANALAQEVAGFSSSWGGYLEHLYVAPGGRGWVRQPSTLQFFMVGERLWGDDATVRMIPRVIAYDPGAPHGRVLAMPPDGPMVDFHIEDLLHPHDAEEKPGLEFWDGWKPALVAVTIQLPDEIRSHVYTLMLDVDEVTGVICDLASGRVTFGLTPELIDRIGERVMPHWGRRYVSTAS